jgi:peptidoglycan/LPS O-acetylase OafA/YrhL
MGRVKSLSRLPSLDGWRAVSIAIVLGAHTTFAYGFPEKLRPLFRWSFDGNLGVRCFFVISGFLITWLMLREADDTGRVNLKHFYARRALRILPVYCAVLLTLGLLQLLTPYHPGTDVWIGNLTFTRNYFWGDFTTEHLWSLSVEEQFYFLWPGIFVVGGLAASGSRWRILILPVLLAPFCRAVGHSRPEWFLIGALTRGQAFFSHFDSLAMGCACAALLARRREWITPWFKANRRAALVTGVALIVGVQILNQFTANHSPFRLVLLPLGPTLQNLGLAILILLSVLLPEWGIFRCFNWWWIRRTGVLSYSIYIWQQLFCTQPEVFGLGKVWWMSFPGWLVPVFAVSFVSYYGLERPFLKLRARLHEA